MEQKYLEAMKVIVSHIEHDIGQVDPEGLDAAVNKIVEVRDAGGKIFIVGSGRSGSVAKTFAIRLSQFPERVYFRVYFAADIARKVESHDLVMVLSGSGRTASAAHAAKKAKEIGASVLAVTSAEESELMNWVDISVTLTGGARCEDKGQISSLAPLGTLFECSVMVFLDCMIAEIMKKLRVSEAELQHYQLDDL